MSGLANAELAVPVHCAAPAIERIMGYWARSRPLEAFSTNQKQTRLDDTLALIGAP